MRLERVKVGKKFRIKFKDEKKLYVVTALVTSNDIKKKVLKFETKEDIYECEYGEIVKIQSLKKICLEITLCTIALLGFWYFTPYFHRCSSAYFNDFVSCYDEEWVCRGLICGCEGPVCDAKPIIYIYPEKKTNITVELGYPQNTTHTYPKYNGAWQVQAEPNGNLTDLKTGRHYYALYWEGKNTVSVPNPKEGFVVSGKDTISFLEEKLDQLGLTEREAEEFIVYWLPKLESERYNFIRFQTLAEQDKNMPLIVTPTPQTMIRVMMEYDSLDKPVQIKEQILPPKPQRNGFTAVEWGGTKIKIRSKK